MSLLSIDSVMFSVWGYPMSYIEFFGTIFNLWCVWLAAKRNVLTWPVGIVGIILYFFLFYQIRLYSDLFEQAYFFVISFWGWWVWSQGKKKEEPVSVTRGTLKSNITYAAAIAVFSLAAGYLMSHIHEYLPTLFPEAASFPYLDAFTTVMSFVATIMMARRKFECWYLWILVDIIGVWLYYSKGVRFIAAEYLIFLVMAVQGFITWRREAATI